MMARWFSLSWFALLLLINTAVAQPPAPLEQDSSPPGVTVPGITAPSTTDPTKPKLNLADAIPGLDFGGGDTLGPKLFLSAKFELEEGRPFGRLLVTAELAPGFHTYSLTQKKTAKGIGPNATKLTLLATTHAKLAGPFTADSEPKSHIDTEAWQGLALEEHYDKVTWSAPLQVASNVDPATLTLRVEYDGQVCNKDCTPITEVAEAKYAGTYMLAKATGEFRPELAHVTWRGHIEPQAVVPGGTAKLILTATPDEPYHVYAYSVVNDKKGFSPTLIAPQMQKLPDWTFTAAKASTPVVTKPSPGTGFSELTYHAGPVTWTMDFQVPTSAALGEYELAGLIGFQTCIDTGCDMPTAAQFSGKIAVAEKTLAGETPIALTAGSYSATEKLAIISATKMPVEIEKKPVSAGELFAALGLALVGGFILNLMPCVLPVIGLKIIQFAEQAGQNRAKVIALNLAYCAGLMFVFMVLATLAVFLNLGWGEHFGVTWFQVSVAGIIFAMALSFLGVWEIPLPGFVGGDSTNELQQKEGFSGAFFKGIITTLLATPCSGPFLGSVFGLTLRYPPSVTYLIFACIGLGMASPYLLIGAQPSLVRWIPKPGAWMETLKQLMGFVLLGTVVYLFATIAADYRIAALTLMIAIWFACWWIGRTPVYAETSQKVTAWLGGTAVAAAIGWAAFTYLGPHGSLLPWQDFSDAALAEARAQGKTVMVDFTASWCPTCHLNYNTAIDTEAVLGVVQKNGVVPMIADWSDRGDSIKRKLAEHDSTSIPLLVIYPADGGEPIVLRDLVVQSQVVNALEKAGPSIDGKATSVARRE
ncbi:MAG TPA: thioredoxin family protein [Pirellulaceae bacterium]|nr:thioredoxin family protein [Pirellulaceae bacterium]